MRESGGKKIYYVRDAYNAMESPSSSPEIGRPTAPLDIVHRSTTPHILFKQAKSSKSHPCFWVLASLLLLSIVVIVALLIIFYITHVNSSTSTFDSQQPKFDEFSYEKKDYQSLGKRKQFLDPLSRFYKNFATNIKPLVSPEYVFTALRAGKSDVKVLDTLFRSSDPASKFNGEHIPKTQWFSLDEATSGQSAEAEFDLKHPLHFQEYVRTLGVNTNDHVILYDHGETHWSFLSATYSWWLFRLYGHSRVSVMQGGLNKWREMRFDLESHPVSVPVPGNFTAGWVGSQWLATYDDVIENHVSLDDVIAPVVDTRLPDQFNGSKKSPGEKFSGHIPEAINLPISLLLNDDSGTLKDKKMITHIIQRELGNKLVYGNSGVKSPIIYGNTGLSGSVVVFALHLNEYESRLYDAGWLEWNQMAPPLRS